MREDNRRFTAEELAIAKGTDLCDVAATFGFTVKRVGNYHTLQEMNSIRIYNRKSWFRWSREHDIGERGGSQIDFLKVFEGMETKEAVFWLLDFTGYRRAAQNEERPKLTHQAAEKTVAEKKKFVLPAPAPDNRYLYSYLQNERAISKETIDFFVCSGLIYEAAGYHNIVFKGNDKDGKTRFASMRGVFDRNGKTFKCDVEGNDKNYGFNVVNEDSGELAVFEAGIDAMSYADIFGRTDQNLLALGMLSDAPLTTFLSEHPQIHSIQFCLDNDEPGRKATEALMQKYYESGYEVEDKPPPKQYKDYNQWLQEEKKPPHMAWDMKPEFRLTAKSEAIREEWQYKTKPPVKSGGRK